MSPPPPSLRRRQFLVAADLSQATCLWEALSIDALRDYIDPALEPVSFPGILCGRRAARRRLS